MPRAVLRSGMTNTMLAGAFLIGTALSGVVAMAETARPGDLSPAEVSQLQKAAADAGIAACLEPLADEAAYVAALEAAGWTLRVRGTVYGETYSPKAEESRLAALDRDGMIALMVQAELDSLETRPSTAASGAEFDRHAEEILRKAADIHTTRSILTKDSRWLFVAAGIMKGEFSCILAGSDIPVLDKRLASQRAAEPDRLSYSAHDRYRFPGGRIIVSWTILPPPPADATFPARILQAVSVSLMTDPPAQP